MEIKRLASDCDGNELENYRNTSLKDCMSNCSMRKECTGISYLDSHQMCTLKSGTCDYADADEKANPNQWNYYKKGEISSSNEVVNNDYNFLYSLILI